MSSLIYIFLGFTFCAGALGGALGYIAGGQTLKLFVDIDKVDTASYVVSFSNRTFLGLSDLFCITEKTHLVGIQQHNIRTLY